MGDTEGRGKNREVVFRLLDIGRTAEEISKITGLSLSSVYKYMNDQKRGDPVEKQPPAVPEGFWRDWTAAVNRIRRYAGKEELPMPEEGEHGQREI